MEGILMSFLDLVPVGLFLAASIILQRSLYNKMSKGAFALFASGTILVFIAGFLKAVHKFIYFAFNTNFKVLSSSFFPFQTLGFALAAIGLVATLFFKQGEGKTYAIGVPAIFIALLASTNEELPDQSSNLTMVFVVLMILGVATMYGILSYFAIKIKSIPSVILLIVAFVCTLGMGYLATKEGMSDWIKEIINSIGQGCLLAAVLLMKAKGLENKDSLQGALKD